MHTMTISKQLLTAIVLFITALPILVLAVNLRNGKALNLISGYDPARVSDKQGFGMFVGNRIGMMGIAIMLIAASIGFLNEQMAMYFTLGLVLLLQIPLISLVIGQSKFFDSKTTTMHRRRSNER
jgi:hypothetical protein